MRIQRGAVALLAATVLAALLATVIAFTGLAAGPASAAAVAAGDPLGDMAEARYDPKGQLSGWEARPARRNGDISRFWVDHRPHRLALSTRVAGLDLDGVDSVGFSHLLRTPSGPELRLSVVVQPEATVVALFQLNGLQVPCPGIRTAVALEAPRTVLATVPRRCLGRPDWVEASARTTTSTESGRYFSDRWGSTEPGLGDVFTAPVPVG